MSENKKERYSYSKLGTYHNCPYSYKLIYQDHVKRNNGVYGVLGSKLHEIMERLEHDKITKEDALNEWETEVDILDFADELNFPTENAKNNYLKDVELYLEHFKPLDFENKETLVEQEFEIELCGITLMGYIDLAIIDHDKKEITIVDYKTSSKNSFTKDKLVHKCHQLMLYAKAMEERYKGYKIVETKFDMVKYGEHKKTGRVKERKDIPIDKMEEYKRYFISVPFNDENYKVFEDYVSESLEKINDAKDKDEWEPEVNMFFCSNLCGVSSNCKFYQKKNKYKK